MKGNKVLAAAGVLAGLYGVGIGLAAKARQPRNTQEARQDGSLSGLASSFVKDAAITFGDDALAIAALPLLKRRFKSMGGVFDTAMGALAIGGAGVGGAIAGHDFQNYIAARQYRSRDGDLRFSQQLVPDNRINAIPGFNNNGMVGQNRMQQTGIGSPAGGGIFYRMWHNPFADMLNQSIAAPNAQNQEDPRGKALGYALAGHLVGAGLGASRGIGRATVLGIVGGLAGGAYGMYSAHNTDLQKNAAALGDIGISVLPTLATGGLIYGLSHARLGKFGAAMRSGLNKTTGAIGHGGKYAMRSAAIVGQAQVGLAKASMRAQGTFASVGNSKVLNDWSAFLTGRRTAWNGSQDAILLGPMAQRGLSGATSALTATAQFGMTGARQVAVGAAHVMTETGKSTSHWDQSIGVGHILAFGPHQVMMAGAAASIYQDSNKRGKHSTNAMSSNNRR